MIGIDEHRVTPVEHLELLELVFAFYQCGLSCPMNWDWIIPRLMKPV